jgi:hypothetical protein
MKTEPHKSIACTVRDYLNGTDTTVELQEKFTHMNLQVNRLPLVAMLEKVKPYLDARELMYFTHNLSPLSTKTESWFVTWEDPTNRYTTCNAAHKDDLHLLTDDTRAQACTKLVTKYVELVQYALALQEEAVTVDG